MFIICVACSSNTNVHNKYYHKHYRVKHGYRTGVENVHQLPDVKPTTTPSPTPIPRPSPLPMVSPRPALSPNIMPKHKTEEEQFRDGELH